MATIEDFAQAVIAQIAAPKGDVTMSSSANPLDDTRRMRLVSHQKQEPENGYNGGESVWLDTAPLAKAMLTWRLPFDTATRAVAAHNDTFTEGDFKRVVWVGAHWFAQDQPDNANPTVIHGHWSVETPVPNGQLHTRFQIFFNDRSDPTKVGSEVALISTNRSDFMIDRNTVGGGETSGRFILAGSHALERMVEFSRNNDAMESRRWRAGVTGQTESGANAGANFAIRRHADDGTDLGFSLHIRRATGGWTVGSDEWAPPSDPSLLMVTPAGETENGVFVKPKTPLTTGAAFKARLAGAAELLLQSRIGTAGPRYSVQADGLMRWGDGTAEDTTLQRTAWQRLATNGEFDVAKTLRVGGATSIGSSGAIAIKTATPPTGPTASGVILYTEGGALKAIGSSGTITTIAPA